MVKNVSKNVPVKQIVKQSSKVANSAQRGTNIAGKAVKNTSKNIPMQAIGTKPPSSFHSLRIVTSLLKHCRRIWMDLLIRNLLIRDHNRLNLLWYTNLSLFLRWLLWKKSQRKCLIVATAVSLVSFLHGCWYGWSCVVSMDVKPTTTAQSWLHMT